MIMRVCAKVCSGLLGALLLGFLGSMPARAYVPKPAVAVEAEDFTVEQGWKVVKNGQGNYMVDIVGYQHIGGERLLCIDEKDTTASAYKDITVPQDGDYRLWVRYEYPPFTDDRFTVEAVQGGKTVASMLMGAKDNPRLSFGDTTFKAQYDPSWGSEGLSEEVVDVKGLKAGPARIYLKGAEQPQVAGVAAHRNIDFIYLSSDVKDEWRKAYTNTPQYPILDAFRDTVGARYEVQITNTGTTASNYTVDYVYNRIPWYFNGISLATNIAPQTSTAWFPLTMEDTAHSSPIVFNSSAKMPFTIAFRPVGGQVERTLKAPDATLLVYVPSYPGKGETVATAVEEINAALKLIADSPKVGKKPTVPLAYGGWLNLGYDSEYSRKYTELYATLGMRSFGAIYGDFNTALKNLKTYGIEMNQSLSAMEYRNPPTVANIAKWKDQFTKDNRLQYLKWYDYGDEIAFGEWLVMMADELKSQPQYKGMTTEQINGMLWQNWLAKNRPGYRPADYWRKAWGEVNAKGLKPDSSAAAAAECPRLYVDSLQFYSDMAITSVAAGCKRVKEAFGPQVLCGANYSPHPFYYPTVAAYIRWFRGGAADMGRHSDYSWEVGQPGPMVVGYVAEHFRSGMRYNPQAVLRQYTLVHSPGNTHASFLRDVFTNIAHGAKMIDFFGMGMNESFTENYIDHRDHQRYKDMHDAVHSIGLVEDLLPQSTVLPSKVAMLISESTERWDFASAALEQASVNVFGGDFRKIRLSYHQERLGLWYALTFAGAAPDFLIEEDINPATLKDYKVLYIVGDSLPTNLTPVLEKWVKGGGILMATAGVGRYDAYRQPNPDLQKLLGIASRKLEERAIFIRPRMELPFLKPLSTVKVDGLEMPQIATYERITTTADAKPVATFADDNSAAVTVRKVGKGQIYYCAALPGLAYMWTALQPAEVPDRGPHTHPAPTNFDKGATDILNMPLQAAKFEPLINSNLLLVDTRLLKAPKGYVVPIANYNSEVGQKTTLSIKLDGTVTKVTSSYQGDLPFAMKGGRLEFTIPALGYGDMVRIDTK